MTRTSITCPVCRRTSHHPDDVREGYCGSCHDWTGLPSDLADHVDDVVVALQPTLQQLLAERGVQHPERYRLSWGPA